MRVSGLVIIFFFAQFAANAQSYFLGLNPSKLDWGQIETEDVRVVFPLAIEGRAQRVANLATFMADTTADYRLGTNHRKVDIILHNQTLIPNGFVTVSPWRSEFYVNGPMQNFAGAVDWLDLLTVHEFRHIHQFSVARKGMTKLISWLYGQNGWGGATVLALPRWFLEGDAVFYETAMTDAGRGRMPDFRNEYKALFLSDRKVSYEKASATSLKHFVPNHYTLGYYMTTSLRRRFGEDAWDKLVDDAVRYKGILFPLGRAIRKRTGQRPRELYESTIAELRTDWEAEVSSSSSDSELIGPSSKKTFTNYRNAQFLDGSTLVVEKSGFRDIPAYYTIDLASGKEEKLTSTGFFSRGNATISVSGEQMAWAQRSFDERWGNEDFTEIILFDVRNGLKRRITHQSKYLGPALHPDGDRLIAVYMDPSGSSEIHVLATSNGSKELEISHPDGLEFAFPAWKSPDAFIVVGKMDSRNAIFQYNLSTDRWEQLTPFWAEQVAYPQTSGGIIYFEGIFGGTDNIFALEPGTDQVFRVTNTKFGGVQPAISPDGKTLVYSEYTAEGYELRRVEIDRNSWTPVETAGVRSYADPVLGGGEPLAGVGNITFPVRGYRDMSGVKLHSWSVYAFPSSFSDPINSPVNLSVLLEADNVLSTFSSLGSLTYNLNENRTSYGISAKYGRFYPVFDVGFSKGRRNRYIPIYKEERSGNQSVSSLDIFVQEWDESKMKLGVILPLNLSAGNSFSRLWLTGNYEHLWVDYNRSELGTSGSFGAVSLEMDFQILRRRAIQHVNPRWGFVSNIQYKRTVGSEFNKSTYFQTSAITLLPGLFRNHSFYVNGAFNVEPFEAAYKFRDDFFYARGYGASIHDHAFKVGANYKLPLLYPDFALGPVAYIRRIVGNFFYDFSRFTVDSHPFADFRTNGRVRNEGRFNEVSNDLASFGSEITFDFRLFRSLDMNMGFRYSRLLEDQGQGLDQFELIIVSLGVPQ